MRINIVRNSLTFVCILILYFIIFYSILMKCILLGRRLYFYLDQYFQNRILIPSKEFSFGLTSK